MRELIQKIEEKFGAAVVAASDEGPFPCVQLKASALRSVLEYCHGDSAFRMDFLECVTGLDNGEEFCVIHHLYSTAFNTRINLKTFVSRHDPKLPSVADLWPSAFFHEIEVFEMFGIVFEGCGHARDRRLLLPSDWRGYPLRKDYVYPEEYNGIEHRRSPLRKEHPRP